MAGKTKQMIGKKFGMLTVLSVDEPIVRPNGTRSQMLKCKCDCGNETVVSYSHLKYGGTKSCGCAKHIKRYEDLTGKTLWECVCGCGNITKVNSRDLKSGNTVSYGKKYRAFIQCDGKSHELGRFDRFEDAVFARRNGEKEYFAEFAIERNE